MRVALITHQFFPAYYTGVERLTLNVATQLRRMGHESVVVTPAGRSAQTTEPYAYAGTRVRPVEAPPADLARPWLHDRVIAPRVGRILDEERADLVHVMQPMSLSAVFEQAHERNVPVVAHVPDFGYLCARVNMLRLTGELCTGAEDGEACAAVCRVALGHERVEWGRSVLARVAAVASPSRFAIAVYASQGFETAGWHHVPWGVDYSLHEARSRPVDRDELVVGFIGTLLAHKGPDVAIAALRLLPGRTIALRLYGASFHETGYEAHLRRLAADDPRVTFHGSYDHAELPGILAELDAVVIPSLWHENLPTTGLNAIAAGVPVVASNVGGLVELVEDYDCGFTFPVGDAAGLAGVLDRLLDDWGLLAGARQRMRYPPGVEEEAWRLEAIYTDAMRRMLRA